MASSSSPPELWALDFDGVVCDSCGESSISAWKVSHGRGTPSGGVPTCCRCLTKGAPSLMQAASALWPDVFNTEAAKSKKAQVLEQMRAVRPVVETG